MAFNYHQVQYQHKIWCVDTRVRYFNSFSDMMERLAERLHIPELIFRACRFLLRSFLTFHWGALTLIAVPFMQDKVNESSNHVWFFYEDENFMNENFDNIYLICFYRAVGVSLANVNMEFMASMGDFMVTVAFHMLGTVYIAYVYVEVLDLMTSKFEPETKYDEFMTQLQEYMKNKQLPINIQDRLISFYEYRFRNAFFKEATFKATLSDRLQKEISMYGCEQMMKSVDLFQYLSKNDIEDLVKALQVQVYLPKDLIIKAGSIGNMMYFLSCGTVAVYTPSGKEVCHLYDGSYFGEIALIMKDKKRTATVIAVEICEVYILDRYTFNRRLVSNETIYNIIFNLCQQRIKETKAVEVLLKKSAEHAEDETAIELIEEYD